MPGRSAGCTTTLRATDRQIWPTRTLDRFVTPVRSTAFRDRFMHISSKETAMNNMTPEMQSLKARLKATWMPGGWLFGR